MRIAVISDIHGNIAALDAVLADIAGRAVDRIVNLGDICSGGLFPAETLDRLIPLALPTIRGNHERQLVTLSRERMGESDLYAALHLRADQLQWLAELPASLRVEKDLLLVHGTPDSDLACFLETVTDKGIRPATPDEVEQRAGSTAASVILCGHTHLPRTVRLADGRLILNPGSVGLPAYREDHPFPHVVENGSPHARYAIVTRAGGRWSAELLAVEYDWAGAARDAAVHGRADWAHALLTGRAGA